MLAYVAISLAWGVSPTRALWVLRVAVFVMVSYLYMPIMETVTKFTLPLRVGGDLRFMVFATEPIPLDWGLFVSAWLAFLVFAAVVLVIVSVAVNTEGIFGQSHGRADMVLQLVKTALIVVTY